MDAHSARCACTGSLTVWIKHLHAAEEVDVVSFASGYLYLKGWHTQYPSQHICAHPSPSQLRKRLGCPGCFFGPARAVTPAVIINKFPITINHIATCQQTTDWYLNNLGLTQLQMRLEGDVEHASTQVYHVTESTHFMLRRALADLLAHWPRPSRGRHAVGFKLSALLPSAQEAAAPHSCLRASPGAGRRFVDLSPGLVAGGPARALS